MSRSGPQHVLSLADLIQVGAINRRTFRARVRGASARGVLFLAAGELVHAVYGELQGPEAVYAMLADTGVRFDVELDVPAEVRSIYLSWQQLMLEAARRADEASSPHRRPAHAAPADVGVGRMPVLHRIAWGLVGAIAAMLVIAGSWWAQGRWHPRLPGTARARPATTAARPDPAPFDAAQLTDTDDAQPVFIAGPAPRAPAVELGLTPTIVLRVLVDRDGRVADAHIYRSRPDLAAFEEAALAIAPELRFQAARHAGEPVAVWLNWPVSFAAATPAPAETLRIKGSDTIGGALGPALARAYTLGHPGVDISVEALGSSTAFVGLFDGSAELGASSRPVNEQELAEARRLGIALEEFVIGYDGVAVIVHPENPVGRLTLAETAQLFTGQITNWRELGGPDQPVHLYSRPSYSGTHGFFKDRVVRAEFAAEITWVEESRELVARVAADPGAVSYIGLGWVDRSVRPVPIAAAAGEPAIEPDADSVRNSSYSICRPLLMYSRGTPRGLAAAFLRFVLSPTGQQLVQAHGFVGGDVSATAELLDTGAAGAASPATGPALLVQFGPGSARLDAAGLAAVLELGARVAASDERVLIIGHADAEGARDSNLATSWLRARTVAAFLRRAGVPAEHIELDAVGSDRPLATNQTGAGRDQNRRVELFVLPPS